MAKSLRIMTDTNVLYSAFIHPGKSMDNILTRIILNHRLILSDVIINELLDTIQRKRPDKLELVRRNLKRLSYEKIASGDIIPGLFKIRDAKDYPILHAAIRGDADILITGDKDFSDVRIDKPKIMTPAEFLGGY